MTSMLHILCNTKKVLMQHHDAIKHCVKDLCAAAGLHVWNVEVFPFGRRESHLTRRKSRAVLISLSSTTLEKRGSAMAVDISIANPFSKVGGANPKPFAAAALSREEDKMNKYAANYS